MISFEAYKTLSQDLQAEILWQFGVYLDLVRTTPRRCIELYALDNFYVEMHFSKKTEEPLFLRPLNKTKDLEPYLRLIEIDSLLETK